MLILINSIIIFLFIYVIKFSFLPTYTARIILFMGFIYFVFSFLSLSKKRINLNLIHLLSWIGLYLIFTIISIVTSTIPDDSYANHNLVFFFQCILGSIFICIWFRDRRLSSFDIALSVQIATVLQSVFIVLGFISPSFRELTLAYLPVLGSNDSLDPLLVLYRSRGLTNFTGSSLSLVQSIGFLLSFYLLVESLFSAKKSNINYFTWYFFLSISLISASIILTGRTGIIALPISFYYLQSCGLFRRISFRKLFIFSLLPLFFLIAIYLLRWGYQNVLGGWTTAWGEDGFDQLTRWWSSEFLSSGRVTSKTAAILINDHFHLPHDEITLLFGDQSTWDLQRIQSDIGYIRRIYASGIFGAFIFYFSIFKLFEYAYKFAANHNHRRLFVSLGLLLFISEFKEPFMSSAGIAPIYMVLCLSSLLLNERKASL